MASQAASETTGVYELKTSPYSSHSVLIEMMPQEGHGRRVLDLGCGEGYIGEQLAQRGFRVVGVELAGATTAQFPRSVELVEADLDEGVPEVGSGYSFILCADILEHLHSPLRLLKELPMLLAKDGLVLASLPNSGNIYFRLNVLAGRFPQHERGLFDRTHLHYYTWNGWRDLFHQAGYRIETRRVTGIPVSLALRRWQGALPVRAFDWCCYELARLYSKMFAYQFVVSARPGCNQDSEVS